MKLIANLSDIDRKTTLQTGISAEALMENAGTQVALAVQTLAQTHQRGVLVCGPGNNGGDGFVCARKLYESGYASLSVIYTGTGYRGESLKNLEKVLVGVPVEIVSATEKPEQAIMRIQQADFIVDALFGSGLSRNITGIEARLIDAINQRHQSTHCPVMAIDLPSGINSEQGQTMGVAIQATHTVTFATGKPGLYLYPGKACAGSVSVVDIGIPAQLIEADESPLSLISHAAARSWLPPRAPDSHKYHHGHVLVIAGSQAMPGAAILCAEAAMRCGAGLVTLAAPATVFNQLPLLPEIMRLPLSDEHQLGPNTLGALQNDFSVKKYKAVVIGPGLGRTPETIQVIQSLLGWLKSLNVPVVVDADGLFALGQSPMALSAQFIVTPHAGECARLLGMDGAGAIMANLPQAAHATRERYGANVVLKAASTVITTLGSPSDGPTCWISPTGNAGMATAGSGDVLAGIIGAFAAQMQAQQKPVWQAGPLGVYIHGLAGDAAADTQTQYAMLASHISQHLPHAFRSVLAL
ncbi:NAD(P)H-hydrate dehydratase [Vampirovibrio sp.]|uniref:NAD(P)H-hydrate dehydratase n=1 Tax=Vampirovibrio sp. TaxID=2717857 RepID=UPI003592EE9A